ncbi:MAG: phosphomannomutase/phosphoglucomutase [Candidatus Nomurabacteria bacterium]|jgi:phosphomannomutase/phosphoglucomutase|nr:phosphomannomutase/phosphoglucomutase [Candidatus Nomurabacteria bacterium]
MNYKTIKNINPLIFRGYDIRGVAGEDLSPDVYYTFGRALATRLARRKIDQCQVGRDCRLSSDDYTTAIIAGLNDGGINTLDMGLCLTQMTYYSVYDCKNKAAVMITASHNPKEFNGLKISTGYSESMTTEEIQDLRKLCESGNFVAPKHKGTNASLAVFESYKNDIIKRFNLKKKWRVVVDGCTSGSGVFYPKVLRAAGCEVIEQNCVPDGNFPLGTPDPTEVNVLERLGEGVRKSGADIGFAYDSDGDRMSVVDENGQPLWMDVILAIFAKGILATQPNAEIVYNTLCSRAVTESIESDGGKPVMWKTGHSFIKAKMIEDHAAFGGELSGHIFFYDNFYGYDDGANASLRLLDYLETVGKSVGEVAKELPLYVSSPQIKLELADEIKFQFIDKQIAAAFRQTWPEAKFTTVDGIRMDLPDRMAIVRASQNGPYIAVKFEGKSVEIYNDVRKKLLEILQSFSEIGWQDESNAGALLDNKTMD